MARSACAAPCSHELARFPTNGQLGALQTSMRCPQHSLACHVVVQTPRPTVTCRASVCCGSHGACDDAIRAVVASECWAPPFVPPSVRPWSSSSCPLVAIGLPLAKCRAVSRVAPCDFVAPLSPQSPISGGSPLLGRSLLGQDSSCGGTCAHWRYLCPAASM